jgi:hypothetical protein
LADGRRLSGDRGRWADCPAVFLYIHDAVKELNPSHSPTDAGVRWSQPNERGGRKERKKERKEGPNDQTQQHSPAISHVRNT